MTQVRKVPPAPGYPPEEGCYLRGNDYSPVAVLVILIYEREKTPPGIEQLVRTAVESGAALAGTLQTENIGLEKVICNVVANPNIRYLVVCGPESPGHHIGETILALMQNGIDADKRIIGTTAPTPYLFNIPAESVARFRKQVTVIDLINEGAPDLVRQAVCACYQEQPTPFCGHKLHDPGAFPEPPLVGGITWRITRPELEPKNEAERGQIARFRALADRLKKAATARQAKADAGPGPSGPLRVLFLCTGNSCRSQMAEGWARHLKSGMIDAWSAGIVKHGLNPLAVKVMAEAGVDISGQTSKTVAELPQGDCDVVITLCDDAHAACPVFPGRTKVIHVGFDDPPRLAAGEKTEAGAIVHYRRMRDEIKSFIEGMPGNLKGKQ